MMSACYAPTAPSGLPCSESGACPSGQTCVVGVCRRPGDVGLDASTPDALHDAMVMDAPVIIDAQPNIFGPPVKLVTLSTTGEDYGVTVSSDELEIVYSSTVDASAHTLYQATRAAQTGTFGTPLRVSELDDASTLEFTPELMKNRLGILFVVDNGTVETLMSASRSTTTAVWSGVTAGLTGRFGPALGANDTRMLVTNAAEEVEEYARIVQMPTTAWPLLRKHTALKTYRSATMSDDGLEVFLEKNTVLYRSVRGSINTAFGAPQKVTFGTPWDDYAFDDPELSRDGHTLYMSVRTNEVGATFDIYASPR